MEFPTQSSDGSQACIYTPFNNLEENQVEADPAAQQESLILNLALKRFPEISESLIRKLDFHQRNIACFTAELKTIQGSRYYFLSRLEVLFGSMFLGVIVGASSGFHLVNRDPYSTEASRAGIIGFSVQLVVGVAILVLGVTASLCASNCQRITNRVEWLNDVLKTHTEEEQKCLETGTLIEKLAKKLLPIDRFCALWSEFKMESSEEQIVKLFELVKIISKTKVKSLFATSTTVPSLADNLSLILMEDVCRQLKEGPLADEWQKTKAQYRQGIWSLKADPWNRLGIENPDFNAYVCYFKSLETRKIKSLAACISIGLQAELLNTLPLANDPLVLHSAAPAL